MTKLNSNLPRVAYGVLKSEPSGDELDLAVEEITTLGYTIISSAYTESQITEYARLFEETRTAYVNKFGAARLTNIDENHTIRAPLLIEKAFLDIALNKNLIGLLGKLFSGAFILNQCNGVINPPGEDYSQSAWHRDLPYQHFVSSKVISANALYCIDDFTLDNGATAVIPSSHKAENFPSDDFISRHATQIEARAGEIIVMNSMLYHGGCRNNSNNERRGINHIFSLPFFKQQINLPANLDETDFEEPHRTILGFKYNEPHSIEDFLRSRG